MKQGVPEENIYLEIGSATDVIENRSIFFKLINQILKEGDLLAVTKLDRCSRNTLSFLELKNQLAEKGVVFWVDVSDELNIDLKQAFTLDTKPV